MLLPEHVLAQKRGDNLVVRKLDDAARARAVAMASEMVGLVRSQLGAPRGEIEASLAAVDALAKDAKVKAGLAKLVLDRCAFESEAPFDVEHARREVFTRAASARREHGKIDRAAVLSASSHALSLDVETLEKSLYSDLRASHPLARFDAISVPALVAAFEDGQAQAVLLRAEKLAARVRCNGPAALRALLRKLKFLRLLFTVVEDKDAFVLGIDGPMSMFDAGTKYGLQLALALPALEACDELTLEALVRWGKAREPLTFRYEGGIGSAADDAPLPDEVVALKRGIDATDSGWKAKRGQAILNLPGVGVCVPDLELTKGKQTVYVEVLGFWSRDAVWKRVELAKKGLAAKVVFCASARLRVSEDVVPEDASAALYMYKGVMSARAVLERAERLIGARARKA